MSKIYSALVGLGLSVLALGAQPALAQIRTCGTQQANDEQQQLLKKLNPNYDPTPRATTSPSALRITAVSYTLPVIVHVIHNGEAVGAGSNISQAQIQSQLDVLNEDYRKLNADGNNLAIVPAVFQPVRGDAMIQFVAAKYDPNGNLLPEPGIDRVNRTTKGFTTPPYASTNYINSTIKPATFWDPTKYINIWVLNLGASLLGYAQFPDNTALLGGLNASGGAANTDGVVILYSAYGSSSKAAGTYSAPYDKGRTLTHELGHWLGLRHIWGDGNNNTCASDYCNDTPTQGTANGGCPSFPHISCSNSGDQSMNYMDYTNDACMAMFSNDQVARIQAVMAATPRRAELVYSTVACPNVIAATASNNGPGCVGGSLTLTANGPTGTVYSWTGPNGYTSTQQNPTLANLTAAMAGTYTVVISNTTGSCPGTASTTVVVNAPPPTPTLATTAPVVCAGASATLSSSVAGATGPLTYTWSVVSGNGLPAVVNTPTITVTPTQPSVYRLTVNYTGSNCTSTATVAVAPLPTPVLVASPATVTLGSTATLSAPNLVGIPNLTYSWTLVSGNGLPAIINTPTITVTPTRASVYRLTVSYQGSCSSSATVSVGLFVDQWTASAYPVPFNSNGVSVQVATNTAGPLHVRMYDMLGRMVYDQDIANAEVGLTTVALPNSGTLQTGKYVIIVQQSGQEARLNVLRDAY